MVVSIVSMYGLISAKPSTSSWMMVFCKDLRAEYKAGFCPLKPLIGRCSRGVEHSTEHGSVLSQFPDLCSDRIHKQELRDVSDNKKNLC